ncbi:beta strand repeat-containing protein [Paraburkholderia acidiphila]
MAYAKGDYTVAEGESAVAQATNSVAIGHGANASTANSVALGNGALTSSAVATPSGVIGGTTYAYAGASPTGVVSVGAPGAERQVTNVAAGRVSASSTDAVNGSQLYAADSAIAALSAGGGNANAVSYDSSSKSKITLQGANGTLITDLAPGAVTASSTDAVNGAELYGVTQSVTNVSNSITKINNTLTTAGWGAQQNASSPTGYTYGGFITDANGNVSNPAVLYVPNTIGTANAHIVLDPGQGNSQYFVDGNRSEGHLPEGTVISNVANGIQDTDAANVGQVYDIVSQATGGGGVSATPKLMSAMLLGAAPSGSGVNTSGLTTRYTTAAYYSNVAGLGNSSGSTPPSDVARATGAGSIAIGSNAYTPATAGTAVGVQAYTSANDAVALGSGSVANQSNTVSVGNDGTSSYTAYDSNGNPYTIQNAANTRRIVNMAAGEADTDAVNVSQLKGVTNALGGGASVNADGSIAAPSYVLNNSTYSDVGTALQAVDSDAQSGSTNAVKYDSSAHSAVTLGGTGATSAVALHNVAAGALSTSSTDAVNGAQLYATNQNVSGLAGSVTNIAGDVTNLEGKVADAVLYDSSAHSSVTLGGTGATSAVALHNVAAGALSTSSTDAVNGAQLYATNQNVSSLAGSVTNIAGDVTNLEGTVISNVANGIQDTDAANVGQVYDIVNNSQSSGPSVQLMRASLLGAAPSGSGVNTSGLTTRYTTAAYYSNVAGLGNSSGSTPPSDVARATGAGSIAIGSNAYTPATAGTAVGVQAYTSANDAVALGSGSVANQSNTVSVGTYGGESALALGANWYVSDRLLLNAHVSKSTGGGSVGASVGATFGF